jgi:hypothetical protein
MADEFDSEGVTDSPKKGIMAYKVLVLTIVFSNSLSFFLLF